MPCGVMDKIHRFGTSQTRTSTGPGPVMSLEGKALDTILELDDKDIT